MAKSYNILKLSLLFAKFLYQHKQLNLPGIGVFSIDPGVVLPEITEKNSHEFVHHVRFVQKSVAKPDEEFIEFIRVNTGKIRPLAESDLESFLSDVKILLNIGKPFHLEGIGTLQKNRSGAYDFHPGLPLVDKLENFLAEKETKAAQAKQSYEHEYNPAARSQQSGRTIWIVLAILVGLGAIIWGGYSLYNRNTDSNGVEAGNTTSAEPVAPAADTTALAKTSADSTTLLADTTPATPAVSTPTTIVSPSQSYKFIFRLATKNYVMNRYNDLKPANPALNWDTKDSVVYRLYLLLPAAPSDTARIRDSLRNWYGTKRVIIE